MDVALGDIGRALNNQAAADILCDSGELPQRDHESPTLAKEGFKQYWFETKRMKKSTGFSDEAKAAIKGSLTKEEYDKVSPAMRASLDAPARKPFAS